MNFIKVIMAVYLSILLVACVPAFRDYYKPIYNERTTHSSSCGGSGPSNKISIQLDSGVELEVSSSSSNKSERFDNFYFRASILAPSGANFQFESDEILIIDNITKKLWRIKITELITQTENISNSNSNSNSTDSTVKNEYFRVTPISKINGNTSFGYNTLFGKKYFNSGASINISSRSIEYKLENYSIQLPFIIINGERHVIEPIKFLHVRSIGLDPVNC